VMCAPSSPAELELLHKLSRTSFKSLHCHRLIGFTVQRQITQSPSVHKKKKRETKREPKQLLLALVKVECDVSQQRVVLQQNMLLKCISNQLSHTECMYTHTIQYIQTHHIQTHNFIKWAGNLALDMYLRTFSLPFFLTRLTTAYSQQTQNKWKMPVRKLV